jgi:TonB family protein
MGDEVVRVLKLSGKWIPAMYKGKPTAVFFTIPITMKPTNAEDTVNAAAKWGPIDVGPGFPGGDAALKKFLRDNIRYPQEAKEKGICGRIYVQFVVEADGSLTDLKVMKDLGGGCGAEALRVFAKSPKWIPATYHGVAKRIQFIEPVDFVL